MGANHDKKHKLRILHVATLKSKVRGGGDRLGQPVEGLVAGMYVDGEQVYDLVRVWAGGGDVHHFRVSLVRNVLCKTMTSMRYTAIMLEFIRI